MSTGPSQLAKKWSERVLSSLAGAGVADNRLVHSPSLLLAELLTRPIAESVFMTLLSHPQKLQNWSVACENNININCGIYRGWVGLGCARTLTRINSYEYTRVSSYESKTAEVAWCKLH